MTACANVGAVGYALGPMVGFIVHGLRTFNPLNSSQGRTLGARYAASARKQRERLAVRAHFQYERIQPLALGERAVVYLTRVGPARMDDDGVVASLKTVRDELADLLGVDDGDRARISFVYADDKGPFAVKIQISIQREEPT